MRERPVKEEVFAMEGDPLKLVYPLAMDYWLKEYWPTYIVTGVDGAKMKSIIKKLANYSVMQNKLVTTKLLIDSFEAFVQKLPEFYKGKSLAVLDSKFNDIVYEIVKNGANKNQTRPKSAISDIREQSASFVNSLRQSAGSRFSH